VAAIVESDVTAADQTTEPTPEASASVPETLQRLAPAKIKVTGGTAKERKKVRAYLKKWAKHTHITSVTLTNKMPKSTTGLCWALGFGASRIEVRSGLSAGKLKKVVAHEIGHATANFVFRQYTYQARQDILLSKFGKPKRLSTSPSETSADCMAQVKAGKRYLSYQRGGCSKKQLANAKDLWAGRLP
jgi:hypothetical protein